jgi:hypothetical protein
MGYWLLPTKQQWRRWSLPSKLTLIGACVGVIALLFSVYSFYFSGNDEISKHKMIIERATQFSDDLEKIKLLLPTNISLSNCIKSNLRKDFNKKYEECMLSIKQNFKDAKYLLDRNRSTISLLIDQNRAAEIAKISNQMDYLIYEMQNNQFVYEHWIFNQCPERISIISQDIIGDNLKKMHEKYPKCLLSIEGYSSFLDRMKGNKDIVSIVKMGSIKIDKVKSFIYPGNELSIDEYFLGMNNNLYKALLHEIGKLKYNLQKLIDKDG